MKILEALPPHNFPKCTRVVTKYDQYDDNPNVDESETPFGTTIHASIETMNETQPPSATRIQREMQVVPITFIMSNGASRNDHRKT